MATIKEIAEKCNVSVATVSNILNNKPGSAGEETRRRVLEKIKELNYMPNVAARNLKTKSSKSIGVIVEDMTVFSVPNIVDGITECCEEKDYQILLTNLRLYKKYSDVYYGRDDLYAEVVADEVWDLISKQVEGIIYVASHEREIRCIPADLPVPVVMAYADSGNKEIPSVIVNDEDGAYQIMKYVIAQGHKKIGVIMGKMDSRHTQERILGYQSALYEGGILYNPGLICGGDWTREEGYRNTDRLLEHGVTAIFCMNDLIAGGVYDRLEELGIRPGDGVSVIGYDNREVSGYYNPPLTTVELPLHDIGYAAGEIVMKMLAGKTLAGEDRLRRVNCYSVMRKSVKTKEQEIA